MSPRLVYYRYGAVYEEEFPTIREAVAFAGAQEDMGNIWAERVVDSRGRTLITGQALLEAMWPKDEEEQ